MPSCSCERTPLIACPDASTSTLDFPSLLGRASTGCVVIFCFSSLNVFCSSSVHFNSPFSFSQFNGTAMWLKSLINHQQKFAKPRKLSTSFTFVGILYSLIALTFSFSICTSPFPTHTGSMGISVVLKSHFDHLKHRLCFSAILRNLIVHSSSYFSIFARITKSSMQFARVSLCSSSQKILVIIHWNVPGKLYSPKYITFGLNSPLFVSRTEFQKMEEQDNRQKLQSRTE